jgi:hypothetical protein
VSSAPRRRRSRALGLVVLVAAGLAGSAALGACTPGPAPKYELRQWTEDMAFRISSDPSPPHARETTVYKVNVRDKATGQPIEGGEGRIFATSKDGASTWYPLDPGPELGTYYGHLKYITAGQWAVAIQFRRDSTRKLERMDWVQEVAAERAGATP